MNRHRNALLLSWLALAGCSSTHTAASSPDTSGPDAALAEQTGAARVHDAAPAPVMDLDSGYDGASPSPTMEAIAFATVEGDLTCTVANVRVRELLSQATSDNSACASDGDCVCANADTECASRCEVPVNRDRLGDFRAALDAVSAFFLPPLVCACGQTDDDCSACAAACVAGRCRYARVEPDEDDAGAQ